MSAEFRPKVPAQQSDSDPAIKTPKGNINWFSAQLSEEFRCLLTGVTCLENTIIVADNENKNIKRFFLDGKLKDTILLTDPCGVCSLPKSKDIVVTEPDQHQITFCSTDGALKVSSASKTSKRYECIAALDESRLVVGCCDIGLSSVDVIDGNGSVLKSIETNRDGEKLFRNPAAITCLSSGEVLISDAGRDHLICISPEGDTEFTYDAKGRPSGICVDAQGGIYMAQYDSNSVFHLSADGTKESVIVGHGFHIKSPLALAVNSEYLILTEEMPSSRVLVLKDVEIADSGQEALARATTSFQDVDVAGDQACSDKINTRSSQFRTALKMLNETLTEENINALERIGKMQLSEDEILVGIGVHLIKKLTGKAETNRKRSQLCCPCGCEGKLDYSKTMCIGSEDTLHGELDIMSCGVGITAAETIHIPRCDYEKETESSEDEESGAPEAKMMRRSSNGHKVNLEFEKMVTGKQQVTSQAITFGWTQYNRHKDLSPYIPSLYIDGTKFGLFLYNPEKDSLYIGSCPVLYLLDSREGFIERCSGIFAMWLILYHRLFFKNNTTIDDDCKCKFKEQVRIESYYKLIDYSTCVKDRMTSIHWGNPEPAIFKSRIRLVPN